MQVMRLVNNVGSKVEERGGLCGGGGSCLERSRCHHTIWCGDVHIHSPGGGELGALSAIRTGVALTNETEPDL